jgi:hypothetical protein
MTGTAQVNKINDLQHNLNPKKSQLRKIKLSRMLLGVVCAKSLKSNFKRCLKCVTAQGAKMFEKGCQR